MEGKRGVVKEWGRVEKKKKKKEERGEYGGKRMEKKSIYSV